MANEFMEDVQPTSSTVVVPTMSIGTTTVASSISNLPTVSTNTESINSTNTMQRIDDSLTRSKEMKSETLKQIETPRNSSTPPITSDVITMQPIVSSKLDLVESCKKSDISNNMSSTVSSIKIENKSNTDSNKITEFEMKSLITELRRTKKIVRKLYSREEEKNIKLTESLEKIFTFVINSRKKMTEKQATLTNDALMSILKERRKFEIIPFGWIFNFLITIMLLRMIFDIFSIVQVIKSGLIFSKICLLVIDLLGCTFTSLIMISFCFKSPVQIIDLFFCIMWTMLYGIITTVVIVTSPITPVSIIICGYMSMLTCIIQGGIKMYSNYWKKSNRLKHECSGNSIDNNSKNVKFSAIDVESSNQDSQTNQIEISNSFTIHSGNNHFDSRINAIKKLEHTIKEFLIEINGANYINNERFNSVENLNYKNPYESQNSEMKNKNVFDNNTYNGNLNDVDCCLCCFAIDPHPDIIPVWICFGNSGFCDRLSNDCDCGGCDCEGCDCGGCDCGGCDCGAVDCGAIDCGGCDCGACCF